MELHPISIYHLTYLEASQFINQQLTDIRALDGPDYFTNKGLNDYLSELGTRLGAFNNALAPVRKNKETIKIEEQDSLRDQALSFLKRSAAPYEISSSAEEREAAINLKSLFSTYKNLARLNYGAESQGIDRLLSALGSSEYAPMVELLGLHHCVSQLWEKNEAFKTLFGGRSQENAQKEIFDAQSLKKEMLVVYTDFAEYVLAMAKIKDADPLFTNVLSVINTARKYYAGMFARRKGVAAEAV